MIFEVLCKNWTHEEVLMIMELHSKLIEDEIVDIKSEVDKL